MVGPRSNVKIRRSARRLMAVRFGGFTTLGIELPGRIYVARVKIFSIRHRKAIMDEKLFFIFKTQASDHS